MVVRFHQNVCTRFPVKTRPRALPINIQKEIEKGLVSAYSISSVLNVKVRK